MAGWRSLTFGAAAVLMAILCGSLAAATWLTQPPHVTIGFLDGASPETLIIKAFEARLSRERKPPFRLTTRAFPDTASLRAAFTANQIDLAPFATWERCPTWRKPSSSCSGRAFFWSRSTRGCQAERGREACRRGGG